MIQISIVTINLNNRAGLIETLQSIFNQSYDSFEIIVVDGGSTDGSIDVIEQHSDKIHKCVVGEDTGIYNAMNIGIREARGEYVHVLNSGDTYYNSNALSYVDFNCGKSFLCFAVKKHFPKKYVWFPREIQLESFVDVSHPGLIVRSDVYSKNLYNEDFRVVSDSLFIYENVSPASSALSDEILVEMQPNGISTKLSFSHEIEKQSLYWRYGYRSKRRLLLSVKSLLIFAKRLFNI